ncbi:hypothetical protein ACFQX6_29385 [Streptosporangium lutulentum]
MAHPEAGSDKGRLETTPWPVICFAARDAEVPDPVREPLSEALADGPARVESGIRAPYLERA